MEKVTETELQILDQLWEEPGQTIRTLSEAIYRNSAPARYATVQSLLERLEKKGWVSRDRSSFRHRYSASRDRSAFIGRQIQQVANAVCDGSVAALLGQLARSESLTETDREELRRLIDGDRG